MSENNVCDNCDKMEKHTASQLARWLFLPSTVCIGIVTKTVIRDLIHEHCRVREIFIGTSGPNNNFFWLRDP